MAANTNPKIDPRDYDPADWVLHGHAKGRGRLNVSQLRDNLIQDYASFVSSFVNVRDPKIPDYVEAEFASGTLWPQPPVQLTPSLSQTQDYIKQRFV